jgi:hypothetical protein
VITVLDREGAGFKYSAEEPFKFLPTTCLEPYTRAMGRFGMLSAAIQVRSDRSDRSLMEA